MNIDIAQWRARVGGFGGMSNHLKKRPKPFSDYFDYCVILYIFLGERIDICESAIALAAFLITIVIYAIIMAVFSVHIMFALPQKQRRMQRRMRILILILCDCLLITSYFSLVNRTLLIRSGSVEVNPGPPSSQLKFAVWNVDSLLARDGSKKDLVGGIESLY